MKMWVCGRCLEGSIKTAWALQTHPCMLQSHPLLLPTGSSVCSVIAIHGANMMVSMSSVKYTSKLIESSEEVVEASIIAIRKHRSHSTPAVEGQACWTSPQPWDLILYPDIVRKEFKDTV